MHGAVYTWTTSSVLCSAVFGAVHRGFSGPDPPNCAVDGVVYGAVYCKFLSGSHKLGNGSCSRKQTRMRVWNSSSSRTRAIVPEVVYQAMVAIVQSGYSTRSRMLANDSYSTERATVPGVACQPAVAVVECVL